VRSMKPVRHTPLLLEGIDVLPPSRALMGQSGRAVEVGPPPSTKVFWPNEATAETHLLQILPATPNHHAVYEGSNSGEPCRGRRPTPALAQIADITGQALAAGLGQKSERRENLQRTSTTGLSDSLTGGHDAD
jgi:hypothetical protein